MLPRDRIGIHATLSVRRRPRPRSPFTTQLFALLCLALVGSLQGRSWAADIHADGSGMLIYIEGEIVDGDDAKFLHLLLSMTRAGDRPLDIILNSIGGGFKESAALARDVGRSKIPVSVEWDGVCYSACFNLFAAGDRKEVYNTSRVGVHGIADFDGNELGTATATIAQLYRRLGVPDSIVGKFAGTPPSQISLLTTQELEEIGATVEVVDAPFVARLLLRENMPTDEQLYCGPHLKYDRDVKPEQIAFCLREGENVASLVSEMPKLGSDDFWRWVAGYRIRARRWLTVLSYAKKLCGRDLRDMPRNYQPMVIIEGDERDLAERYCR